jgi:hypothetical protein
MHLCDDSTPLTSDERLREVARILAVCVLRLGARAALPIAADEHSGPKNLAESVPAGLEVPGETVLSVHCG